MSTRIILGIFLCYYYYLLFTYLFIFSFDYGELTILVGNTVKVNTVVRMEILERF